MLRRLPTALAISPEDITTYEEELNHRIALMRYRKTGEDPEGRFTNNPNLNQKGMKKKQENSKTGGAAAAIDPNDELKPLPGDKARIVRSREERIMGGGSHGEGTHRVRYGCGPNGDQHGWNIRPRKSNLRPHMIGDATTSVQIHTRHEYEEHQLEKSEGPQRFHADSKNEMQHEPRLSDTKVSHDQREGQSGRRSIFEDTER